MNLILGEHEIHFDVIERSSIISNHTGLELQHIKVNATSSDELLNKSIEDYLSSAETGGITSKEGQTTKKWRLIKSEYRSFGDRRSVNYSLELEEIEELKLNRLILDDLELIPYQYREDFDFNNLLSASARICISESQFKRIKELFDKESITITRIGISEIPKEMILEPVAWSRDEVGIKFQFNLFEQDNEKRLDPLRPLWRSINLLVKQEQIIEHLALLLIKKHVMDEKEYAEIKNTTPKINWDIKLELCRENDLDEWVF